jgi:serine/threonine protein kinase
LFDEQRNAKLIDFGFSVQVNKEITRRTLHTHILPPSINCVIFPKHVFDIVRFFALFSIFLLFHQCKEPKKLKVFCGTPSYMSPEIVKRSEYRGKPVDMWSMGVVLFAMLSGCFPFSAKTYPDLYKKILRGSFHFPDHFNSSLRDLLTGLLDMDPSRRLTVAQARQHPWVRKQQEKPLSLTPCAQFTVSEDPRHDLYREVVTRMVGLGIDREELVGDVLAKRRNSLTSCYYLLAVAMRMRHKLGNHQQAH